MIRIIDNEDSDLINVLVIERRHNAVKLHSIVSKSNTLSTLDACKMYKQERVLVVSQFIQDFPVIRYCLEL